MIMEKPFHGSRRLFLAILGLLLVNIGSGLLFMFVYLDASGHSRNINEAGRIRGSIQRVAKQALAARETGPLIRAVDEGLQTMRTQLGMNEAREREFILVFDRLKKSWKELKTVLETARTGTGWGERLISVSESCWYLSNRLVMITQLDAEADDRAKAMVFILIGINILMIAHFLYEIRVYVRKNLEYRSNYDAITGLLNRHAWKELLLREMRKAGRYGYPLSAVMLDIDFFKQVNDTFGHAVGDSVLRELATLITGQMRQEDALFRIGGEEFFGLLVHINKEQARQAAERWRVRVENHRFAGVGTVTVSLGVAELREKEDVERFFLRVDAAMYLAKKNGRNRTECG